MVRCKPRASAPTRATCLRPSIPKVASLHEKTAHMFVCVCMYVCI
jgi:hypothetical protein